MAAECVLKRAAPGSFPRFSRFTATRGLRVATLSWSLPAFSYQRLYAVSQLAVRQSCRMVRLRAYLAYDLIDKLINGL